MANEQKPRTIDDVHKDYQQLCFNLGHFEHQRFLLSKDIELVQNNLRQLNLEAAKIKEANDIKEAALKEAAAAKPAQADAAVA